MLREAHQPIPAGNKHNETPNKRRSKINAKFLGDDETWWSCAVFKVERVVAKGNSHKLFHHIQATGMKTLNVWKGLLKFTVRLSTIRSDILYADRRTWNHNLDDSELQLLWQLFQVKSVISLNRSTFRVGNQQENPSLRMT